MYKIYYYECKVECEQIIPGKPVFDEGQTQKLNVVRCEHTHTHIHASKAHNLVKEDNLNMRFIHYTNDRIP